MKDGKFYLEWTTDLKRRLEEHNLGFTRSTKSRRPFELIDYETYPFADLAKKRERALKHSPRMLYLLKKCALNKGLRKVAVVALPLPLTKNKSEAAGVTPPHPSREVVG